MSDTENNADNQEKHFDITTAVINAVKESPDNPEGYISYETKPIPADLPPSPTLQVGHKVPTPKQSIINNNSQVHYVTTNNNADSQPAVTNTTLQTGHLDIKSQQQQGHNKPIQMS
jgi:hypothetical protein